jgi:tetratricopeptide (TPR) repeat protein
LNLDNTAETEGEADTRACIDYWIRIRNKTMTKKTKMKTSVKIVLFAAMATAAAFLADCTKQEAPAVPAQPAPIESESAANTIPVPEASGAAAETPADLATEPIQQAPADKPETAPTVATATAPARQPPATDAAPTVPQTAAERAKAHLDRNEFDEAIAAYTEILRQNPGDADAFYNRGDAYYGKGNIDRASADWNEAVRLNSGYAARLGQIPASGAAEAAARAQEAAESMDKALQSNPDYTRAQDAQSRLNDAWDF